MRLHEEPVFTGEIATDTYIAGESATSHSVVSLTAGKVYRATTASVPGSIIGIIETGMTANAPVEVFTRSQPIEGFSGLVADDEYFVGDSGQISNIPPTSGLLQSLGIAIDDTTLAFDIGLAIER